MEPLLRPEYKTGRDRFVILVGNIVIKIAKNHKGRMQNRNEYLFSREHPQLAPRFVDKQNRFKFIVTERVVRCLDQEGVHHNVLWEMDKRYAEVYDAADKILGTSFDNAQIGITEDGRYVLYDAGHNEEFLKKYSEKNV